MTDQPTDVHVHYVPGEDPQTAALRDAVNVNRQLAGIDPVAVMVNRLRADLAEAVEERDRLTAWSDELAHRVPETYEGGEGTQEGCINEWIIDLMTVAGPFAAELRATVEDSEILEGFIIPIPADPVDVEHLYDAAARLGGE